MRKIQTILLLGVAFALTGCFAEDYSFCPPDYNVSIAYRLPDGNGGCTFLRDISTVATAVYDASGKLITTAETTGEDHAVFQGVRLKLDPGVYRIVSWANSGVNTELKNHESCYGGGNAYVTYGSISAGRTGNGDALYYAPNSVNTTRSGNAQGEFVITVDPKTGYEGTLDFRHAHRIVEVYVKGFEESGSTTPDIELTGLPQGLTFLGMGELAGTGPVTAEIGSEMMEMNGSQYSLARFKVFYLNAADCNIGINVLNPVTKGNVFGTYLCDHVDVANDKPDTVVTIRIIIEFLNGSVTVKIPGWNSGEVDWTIFD